MKEAQKTENYTLTAKLLHWLSAIIVLGLVCSGFYMTSMGYRPEKLELYGLHKSFGLLVIILLGARLLWRFVVPPPPELRSYKRWEKYLARGTHYLLYALLFALPLSGWIMSSAGDFPIDFFGLVDVPDLTPKDEALFSVSRLVHLGLAVSLMALVALHMSGAAKHHILDRDTTLERISGIKRMLPGVLLLAIFGFYWAAGGYLGVRTEILTDNKSSQTSNENNALADSGQKEAGEGWAIIHDESFIEFEVKQYGQSFTGQFTTFKGDIDFDPDNLSEAKASVKIDVRSLETGSSDRDEQALQESWFNAQTYPHALFESRSFEKTGENSYEVSGILTLKGTNKAITFPFSLMFDQDKSNEGAQARKRAQMQAELTLDRTDFNIGTGQWQSDSVISHDVNIEIEVVAEKF